MEDELLRLRHKKFADMMKRVEEEKKKEELKKTKEDPKDLFLKSLLLPDAYDYYKTQILPQRPFIAAKILEVLEYLVTTENLQTKITKEEIILIDRKLSGTGPSIRIKRTGEDFSDISTELKKAK
jgi:DNA-binding TFAR19-related protein (PDSD5 family)